MFLPDNNFNYKMLNDREKVECIHRLKKLLNNTVVGDFSRTCKTHTIIPEECPKLKIEHLLNNCEICPFITECIVINHTNISIESLLNLETSYKKVFIPLGHFLMAYKYDYIMKFDQEERIKIRNKFLDLIMLMYKTKGPYGEKPECK